MCYDKKVRHSKTENSSQESHALRPVCFGPTLKSFQARMGNLVWHRGFKGGNDFIEKGWMSLNIFWCGNSLDGEGRVNQAPVKKWQLHLTIIYTPAIYHQRLDFKFASQYLDCWGKIPSWYHIVINNLDPLENCKNYIKRSNSWICVICGQSCAWGGVLTSSSLFGHKLRRTSTTYNAHT